MTFVIASADFSGCSPADRDRIYARLTSDNWKKLHEDAVGTHTVWITTMAPGTKDDIKELTKEKFYSCCKANCLPRVVFEWGSVSTDLKKSLSRERHEITTY